MMLIIHYRGGLGGEWPYHLLFYNDNDDDDFLYVKGQTCETQTNGISASNNNTTNYSEYEWWYCNAVFRCNLSFANGTEECTKEPLVWFRIFTLYPSILIFHFVCCGCCIVIPTEPHTEPTSEMRRTSVEQMRTMCKKWRHNTASQLSITNDMSLKR